MTRNTRFAVSVHILAYLAYRDGKPVPSAVIAASVNTNPVVIRRLLSALVKCELVKSQKGAHGGFTLALPAAEISLFDIYRAVEPNAAHGLCHISPNRRCPVGGKIEGVLQEAFARAQAALEAELERTPLSDVESRLHAGPSGRSRSA